MTRRLTALYPFLFAAVGLLHLAATNPGKYEPGDLLLTGTPGGVALQPPSALVQRIMGLLPDRRRWELFLRSQSRSSAYLSPGDRIEASIRTADGALDLGTQHNRVR